MSEKLSAEEVYNRQQQFDFDKLLEPYREGGSDFSPVRRTMGTIVDYLLYKKNYSIEVIGAAIFKSFLELQAGLAFPGDGSYGSKGRELVTYIRTQCDEFTYKHIVDREYEWITKNVLTSVSNWSAKEAKRKMRPWFIRAFIRKPFIEMGDLNDNS